MEFVGKFLGDWFDGSCGTSTTSEVLYSVVLLSWCGDKWSREAIFNIRYDNKKDERISWGAKIKVNDCDEKCALYIVSSYPKKITLEI